jgi:hypothetical protein
LPKNSEGRCCTIVKEPLGKGFSKRDRREEEGRKRNVQVAKNIVIVAIAGRRRELKRAHLTRTTLVTSRCDAIRGLRWRTRWRR